MKSLIFSLLLVSFAAGAQENSGIAFEAPEAQDPIEVQITDSLPSYSGGMLFGLDSSSRIRLSINRLSPDYYYTTSSGFQAITMRISEDEMKSLHAYVLSASPNCPVSIFLDRKTFHIVRVRSTPGCDPLAAEKFNDDQA